MSTPHPTTPIASPLGAVSRLNLGTNTFGWTASPEQSHAVLDAYVGEGGSFLDSADSYSHWVPGHVGGESEAILGEWLAGRSDRDQLTVATKVSQKPSRLGLSAANVAAAADESLQRLQTDRIDLYYAHADDPTTPIEEVAAAFDSLVTAGKVRHIGISNLPPARIAGWFAAAEAEGLTPPVALQPHYNLVKRTTYEDTLAPLVARHHLAVMPYWALASGFLTGKYRRSNDLSKSVRGMSMAGQLTPEKLSVVDVVSEVADEHDCEAASVAIAWLLTRPGIVAPIASARIATQLPALMAGTRITLDADQLRRLNHVSAAVED